MLRLLVGNLPHACDEESLSLWFRQRGHPVSFARVVRDPTTGRCSGFAFVDLKVASNPKETVKSLHGQSMSGHELTIDTTTPKLPRDGEYNPQAA